MYLYLYMDMYMDMYMYMSLVMLCFHNANLKNKPLAFILGQ